MAKPKRTTTEKPLAVQENGAVENAKKLAAMPVPEGWFNGVIFDVDPEYVAQTTGQIMVVFKLRLTGSLRYGARTFSFFIGKELESTRNDGGSTRSDIIDRFGIDPWENPDSFLDLEIRTHIGTRIMNEGTSYQKVVNRVISVYPKLVKDNGAETEDALQQEIPL